MRAAFPLVLSFLCLGCAGSRPPTADSSACPLRLNVGVEASDGYITLLPDMTNQTDQELRFTLPNPCPVGPAQFTGMGDGFDYDDACVAGECLDNAPLEFVLAPGETRALQSGSIPTRDDSCNDAQSGTFAVAFAIEPLAGTELPVTCGPLPVEVVLP
ncbi:MAG: hypothetical protein AB8I08_22695 [Sandaracinaceae bacterium]